MRVKKISRVMYSESIGRPEFRPSDFYRDGKNKKGFADNKKLIIDKNLERVSFASRLSQEERMGIVDSELMKSDTEIMAAKKMIGVDIHAVSKEKIQENRAKLMASVLSKYILPANQRKHGKKLLIDLVDDALAYKENKISENIDDVFLPKRKEKIESSGQAKKAEIVLLRQQIADGFYDLKEYTQKKEGFFVEEKYIHKDVSLKYIQQENRSINKGLPKSVVARCYQKTKYLWLWAKVAFSHNRDLKV